MDATNRPRIFNLRITARANSEFGALDYSLTETLTARDGGIQVDSHAHGRANGEFVNKRSSTFFAGVDMSAAAAYRKRQGFAEVA